MRFSGTTAGLIAAAAMTFAAAMPAGAATEDWNDAGIKWMGYEEGLAAAKASKKPGVARTQSAFDPLNDSLP